MSTDSEDHPSPGGAATSGMSGAGVYDANSTPQRMAIGDQAERIRCAVRALDNIGQELRLMDYGCGPGENSVAAMKIALNELRSVGVKTPVVSVHSDQIGNAWSDLFATLQGPESYLRDPGAPRVEISVGSFFGPLASAGVVDLGTCFAAVHWLSRSVSAPSPGALFFCDLPQPARDEVAALSARNWAEFLRAHARELRPGAWMVVDMLSSTPDADDPSGVRAAGRGLYRALWRVADALAEDGRIDRAVLDDFVFPVYFRLPEEVRAPLVEDADLLTAFEIIELENETLPFPIEEDLKRTGDVAAYAEAYTGFARAFAEATHRDQLFIPSAEASNDVKGLADLFFDQLRELLVAEPDQHGFEHQVLSVVLRRK